MKNDLKKFLLVFGLSFGLSGLAMAQNSHDHGVGSHTHGEVAEGHDELRAPNGGRLVETVEPNAEFLLLEDRHVQISFINDEGALVAPDGQKVSLIGGDRSNAVRLSFEPAGNVLRSTEALPDIADMPIILQIKPSDSGQTVREKFYLKTFKCGECQLAEYACICGHG